MTPALHRKTPNAGEVLSLLSSLVRLDRLGLGIALRSSLHVGKRGDEEGNGK